LAKGSLTSKTNSEGEIRKAIIEAGLLDCIVNLPPKLFVNTQIPACLWFIRRKGAEPSPLAPLPKVEGKCAVQSRSASGSLLPLGEGRRDEVRAGHG
ncbi:MAG: N-6 DNA methylase, partial [Elusimicrobiota bacterium]